MSALVCKTTAMPKWRRLRTRSVRQNITWGDCLLFLSPCKKLARKFVLQCVWSCANAVGIRELFASCDLNLALIDSDFSPSKLSKVVKGAKRLSDLHQLICVEQDPVTNLRKLWWEHPNKGTRMQVQFQFLAITHWCCSFLLLIWLESPLQHINWAKYDSPWVCLAKPLSLSSKVVCSAAAASAVAGAAVDSQACYESDLSQAEPNLSLYIHSV